MIFLPPKFIWMEEAHSKKIQDDYQNALQLFANPSIDWIGFLNVVCKTLKISYMALKMAIYIHIY
ncbi:MAG: hypothetical protein HYV97_05070 [Bdellovibrio sp.]|nr:hypothetical protein [Bdellovibrio sp.]